MDEWMDDVSIMHGQEIVFHKLAMESARDGNTIWVDIITGCGDHVRIPLNPTHTEQYLH
jgi:hypothetical protein